MTLDWCYAIGCEELGDMPCVYCADDPAPTADGSSTPRRVARVGKGKQGKGETQMKKPARNTARNVKPVAKGAARNAKPTAAKATAKK